MNFTNTTPNKTNDNVARGRGRVCHRPVDCRQCDRHAATTGRPHGSSDGRTVCERAERPLVRNYVVRFASERG